MTPEEIEKIKTLQRGLFVLGAALGNVLETYSDNMTVRDGVAQRCHDVAEALHEVAEILTKEEKCNALSRETLESGEYKMPERFTTMRLKDSDYTFEYDVDTQWLRLCWSGAQTFLNPEETRALGDFLFEVLSTRGYTPRIYPLTITKVE